MNVAVLSMTRDRFDYTRHCFGTLRRNAGCEYDWYVVDQGSTDSTVAWLDAQDDIATAAFGENVGICRALNWMLDAIVLDEYDVIVRFDNDCEVTQPGTLREIARVAHTHDAIVAPHVAGLLNPPPVVNVVDLGDAVIDETEILGGIFMAVPAARYTDDGFRYDERHPLGTGDEAIVPWWRSSGGITGYVRGWQVNHYETTAGQRDRYPAYESRKRRELAR